MARKGSGWEGSDRTPSSGVQRVSSSAWLEMMNVPLLKRPDIVVVVGGVESSE